MKKATRKFDGLCEVAPLFHQYQNQSEPQFSFVELNLENSVYTADYNGEIGNAQPEDVWNGRTRRYPVSPYTTGGPSNEFIIDGSFEDFLSDIRDEIEGGENEQRTRGV